MVLLLFPRVEGFPFWKPEPLNPQNPDFQGWDAQNLSVIGSRVTVKPFLLLLLGSWTKVQHHIKVTDLECMLYPG